MVQFLIKIKRILINHSLLMFWIIITVMNYYSRNSPIKGKKKTLPAGFLLQWEKARSLQPTPRSQFNCTHYSEPFSTIIDDEEVEQSSPEILILDDDTYHVPFTN